MMTSLGTTNFIDTFTYSIMFITHTKLRQVTSSETAFLWGPGIPAYFNPMDVHIKISFHNHHGQKQQHGKSYAGSYTLRPGRDMQHLTPNVKEMKKSDPPICPGREEEPES